MKIKKIFLIFVGVFGISIVIFSSLVYLYEQRFKIDLFFSRYIDAKYYDPNNAAHKKMAKEIMKGGYILHFRHAERDKWIDVVMYDALESDVHENGMNQTRFAENEYFSDAVCLNSRGLIQAKAIGENIRLINLPYSYLISSPSCRSRQTADLAFGGYDELNRLLVHRGPYDEKYEDHVSSLKKLYLSFPILDGSNTIVTSHNGVLHRDMFDKLNPKVNFDSGLGEGGFMVISNKDGKLTLEHSFYNFKDFIKYFFPR